MADLIVPSFVGVRERLPGEEGRLLLIWSDPAANRYRVGLRSDGEVREFQREDLEEWAGP